MTRVEQLEQQLRELGVCPDCLEAPQHALDEPFSSCRCGTGEDYLERPMQRLQALRAGVAKLRNACECNPMADVDRETAVEAFQGFYRMVKRLSEVAEK